MHFFESMNFGSVPFGQLSLTVWLLIWLALLFDFLNGFHDAATPWPQSSTLEFSARMPR
jgi:hypothetical protein